MVAEDRKIQAITEGSAFRYVTSLGDMPDGIYRQPGVERLKCEKSSSHWVQSSAVPATHRDQHGEVLWVLEGFHNHERARCL